VTKSGVDPGPCEFIHFVFDEFGPHGSWARVTSKDAPLSFWTARRVFIADCSTVPGTALAEDMLAREAIVTGLVGNPIADDSPFIRNRLHERIDVVRGRTDDDVALAPILSAREIEILFLSPAMNVRAVHAMITAARKAVPLTAIVLPVVSMTSRILEVAEAFRAASGSAIGIISLGGTDSPDAANQFLIAHAERVILRDPVALKGIAEWPSLRRRAA
jgi:hypothetical protein